MKKTQSSTAAFSIESASVSALGELNPTQKTAPIEQTQQGVKMVTDVIKVSFEKDNPKDIYYHTYGDVPTSATETVRMTAEARIILSQFNQVSITLPDIVA